MMHGQCLAQDKAINLKLIEKTKSGYAEDMSLEEERFSNLSEEKPTTISLFRILYTTRLFQIKLCWPKDSSARRVDHHACFMTYLHLSLVQSFIEDRPKGQYLLWDCKVATFESFEKKYGPGLPHLNNFSN